MKTISTTIKSVFLNLQIKQKGHKNQQNKLDFSFTAILKINLMKKRRLCWNQSQKSTLTWKAAELLTTVVFTQSAFPNSGAKVSCCKTNNDAPVFYLLWWNFINYEICLALLYFYPFTL